jgi:hypothetical protein
MRRGAVFLHLGRPETQPQNDTAGEGMCGRDPVVTAYAKRGYDNRLSLASVTQNSTTNTFLFESLHLAKIAFPFILGFEHLLILFVRT